MPREFALPTLGEGDEEAQVVSVLVSEGDTVADQQPVVEVETDKATLEVPCSLAGRVTKVHVKEGDTIKAGAPLLSIDAADDSEHEDDDTATAERSTRSRADDSADAEDEEAAADRPRRERIASEEDGAEAEAQPEKSSRRDGSQPSGETTEAPADSERETKRDATRPQQSKPKKHEDADRAQQREPAKKGESRDDVDLSEADWPVSAQADAEESAERAGDEASDGDVAAAPVTRRLARELGVDLKHVERQFEARRVTRDHLIQFVRQRLGRASDGPQQAAAAPRPALPDFAQWGPVERTALTSLERLAAARLREAWQAPHVTHCDAADISKLESLRQRFAERADDGEPKLTVTAFAIKAAVHALQAFPRFNASLDVDTQEVILKHYFHVGVAVDTDRGLIVPVLRDCDQKSVLQIAAELEALADETRQRKVKPEQLRGSTFTITNVGAIGGVSFSPVLNYPEVAILGLARAQLTPVLEAGELRNRLILNLCLSYDHRVINGAAAARFTRAVAESLEDPELLMLRG